MYFIGTLILPASEVRVTMHICYRAPQLSLSLSFSYVALRIGTNLRVRPFDRYGLPAALTFRARLHASLHWLRDRRHTIVNCFCGFTLRGGAKEVAGERGREGGWNCSVNQKTGWKSREENGIVGGCSFASEMEKRGKKKREEIGEEIPSFAR